MEDPAKLAARPRAADTNPARGVFIPGAVAVPVELQLDAAVGVGVDFFTLGAGDDGGLGVEITKTNPMNPVPKSCASDKSTP
jgi:hypothetical protein